MRAIALLASLLMTALVVPTASAQTDPPVDFVLELECGPVLPLWDFAMCTEANAVAYANGQIAYARQEAREALYLVGCDIVGGPACPLVQTVRL